MRTINRLAATRPWRVIAVWLVVAGALTVLGLLKAPSVTTDDPAAFLPERSESARALEVARTAFGLPEGTASVAVLLARADGSRLTAADRTAIGRLAAGMPRFRPDRERLEAAADGLPVDLDAAGRVVAASPGPVADRGRFGLVGLQWQANTLDPVAQSAFREFRERLRDGAAERGLHVGLTGGIASTTDAMDAAETRQVISSGLLVAAVLVLSGVFLRGLLAAIVPLLTVTFVAGGAAGLVVAGALLFDVQLDAGTPQLISVVLVGIGVDYFLFLLFRVRERLRAGDDRRTAAAHAAVRVGPVIAAAALVVVAAFATLGLAEFGQFRVLGPAIAVSVAVMLAAGVTLMPALAAVTGRALFWPSRPASAAEATDGPAARLGEAIVRRPARAALAVTALLVVLGTAALGARTDPDLAGGGPATESTRTEDRIAAALPRGATDPQEVYVRSATALTAGTLAPLRDRLARVDGVGGVGAPELTADRRVARLDVALDVPSTSARAMEIARGPLRDAAHAAAPAGGTALVGGTAAVFADVSDAIDRDLRLVFPVAAVLIVLVLVATLRSVVAPLVLLAAVALEFAAALGASVLVVQGIGGAPGVALTLPLVLFLFVVAIGTDYNLLVAARLREEARAGVPAGQAVRTAVREVAPAVTAAGLVLAASFGTLMLAADAATRQTGFAMAVGILLASLAVSVVLVPAVAALLGPRMWWPARPGGAAAARRRTRAARPRRQAATTPRATTQSASSSAGSGRANR